MSRRLYLDDSPGERRGVVTLKDRPERLLIERGDEPACGRFGARAAARVRKVERGLGLAFLELGGAGEAPVAASLSLSAAQSTLVEGALVEVEVAAPARRGKTAVVRLIGPAEGLPRLLRPAPSLAERLSGFAPDADIAHGREAREAADEAEAEALAVVHPLPGGGTLSVEPTRALVAVDVDVGAAAAGRDARRGRAEVNRRALDHAARLLRLKGLGGLVAVDLAGGGGDGAALAEHTRSAFAPDQPGVVIGPVSRFGVLELSLPWRARPLAEVLNDPDGRPSAGTAARRLARAIEAEAGPGVQVLARCGPEVAAAFAALAPALRERLGPRFAVEPDPALDRAFHVRPR